MECIECGSLMEMKDSFWTCDTCFAVLPTDEWSEDTILEEGVMLQDVLKQMKDKES